MPTLHCPDLNRVTSGFLITNALRGWHDAQARGVPVMPHLFALFRGQNCALLAPVFHSLFRFYEAALRRMPVVGRSESLSEDETLLLALVSSPELSREQFDCPSGIAHGFDCALCSARIMLASALQNQFDSNGLHQAVSS